MATPPAQANKKVFRCEVGGRVIFQQSACGTDAVAAAPKAAAPAPNSAASAAAAPRPAASAAAAAKPPASPATPAPPKPAAQPKRP